MAKGDGGWEAARRRLERAYDHKRSAWGLSDDVLQLSEPRPVQSVTSAKRGTQVSAASFRECRNTSALSFLYLAMNVSAHCQAAGLAPSLYPQTGNVLSLCVCSTLIRAKDRRPNALWHQSQPLTVSHQMRRSNPSAGSCDSLCRCKGWSPLLHLCPHVVASPSTLPDLDDRL